MSQRLTAQARDRGSNYAATRFEERAQETTEQAMPIRQALANGVANTRRTPFRAGQADQLVSQLVRQGAKASPI